MNSVTLTELELKVAALVGQTRMEDSAKKGLSFMANGVRSLAIDVLGAECEIAVAKYLNKYPEFSINTFKAADVSGIQVRGTTYSTGRLIIRPNDKDEDTFLLVVKYPPAEFVMKGWVTGKRGKKIGVWEEKAGRPAAWWVPQEKLNPITWLQEYQSGNLTARPEYTQ